MAKITTKLINSKVEWESFLENREEANFLQSWYWGDFHESLGKSVYHTGFYRENKLIGVMLSVIENARRAKYITVAGGPIINWHDTNLAKFIFTEARKIARENNCTFVRIRPQLVDDQTWQNIFKENGCVYSPMHLTADLTSQLDITRSDEELIGQMRKATRYEIRKAEKIGIKITSSKDDKLIQNFYKIQLETAYRQKFVPFSLDFFNSQFKVFFNANKALLFTATINNTLLAQAFIIFYGQEAVYHYGVSTAEGRRFPGAYLLQWEAIKEAKRRGMKKYNFWGVAPIGQDGHRFSGVSLFKRGFGGTDIKYLPAHDLIVDKRRYLLNYVIEFLRKKIRGL